MIIVLWLVLKESPFFPLEVHIQVFTGKMVLHLGFTSDEPGSQGVRGSEASGTQQGSAQYRHRPNPDHTGFVNKVPLECSPAHLVMCSTSISEATFALQL